MTSSRKRKAEIDGEAQKSRELRKRKPKVEADAEIEADSDSEAAEAAELKSAVDLGPTAPKPAKRNLPESDSSFIGDPIPRSEAIERYPRRYKAKSEDKSREKMRAKEERDDGDEEEDWQAKCHYTKAIVDGVVFNLYDNAYIMAEPGQLDYIARILEFFEGVDGNNYCKVQWYYRAEDTAIKDLGVHASLFDKRRVFLSEMKNTNELDCIISKVNIVKVSPNPDLEAKERTIPECDLYYDMMYLLPNLTFKVVEDEDVGKDSSEALARQDSDPVSTLSSDSSTCNKVDGAKMANGQCPKIVRSNQTEMTLLDLYSGCGAMSTGLCIGASLSGVKLVTKWAVDMNQYACESLKLNHPEAEVRNESAEDFLGLLKEWQKLCKEFNVIESEHEQEDSNKENSTNEDQEDDKEEEDEDTDDGLDSEVFEVEKLLAVCYGDPNKVNKPGLYFMVRWKGYDESEDTWEPLDGLSESKDRVKEFVKTGYANKLVPLPGDVDFICGGPPCQGISGFNRFRQKDSPFADTKNFQVQVYMDIIQFLQPRYTLMENVVDLLKFSNAVLGRYAMGRLVAMNYQCRMGMMAAGTYGVPQYRMRVFLWGAHPMEKLAPFPLPTHKAKDRGNKSKEFEDIIIEYRDEEDCQLEDALTLGDALSDLPPVENDERRDEMEYGIESKHRFQKFISLPKHKVVGFHNATRKEAMLFDHRPLKLNQDDYERVQQIPKKKGGNFRDLPGLKVGPDNVVYLDTSVERPLVASGKPLVPEYAIKFIKGKSLKPFGRLWWDEIVSTVVTRAEPHNQIIIHPVQDRVLSIRELARLQGFPDFYQLRGPIKERYIQVGNAVAVPVGTALGYAFGKASQGLCSSKPLIKLPFKFPECLQSSKKQ